VPRLGPRLKRTRRGGFRLLLSGPERDILRALPDELRRLLPTGDSALERLFPPAYQADPAASAEYDHLMREDLVAGKLSALETMEQTIDAVTLTEEQVVAWLGALNDLRLVLGSRLGVTEEMYDEALPEDDPRAPQFGLFAYLGWLEEQVVEALAEQLPQRPSEA
jgi:hypothetical protein